MSLLSLKESLGHLSQPQRLKHQRLQVVIEHWPTIVGTYLAPKSCPTGVYQEVLQVATAGSAWCQELSAQRSIILAKVNQTLQSAQIHSLYRNVHFSTGRWHTPVPNSARTAPPKPAVALPKPDDPITACQRFRHAIQAHHQLVICPHCRSQTLKSDIDRWGMCRFCLRQRLITQS